MPAGRPTAYKPEYCQELIDWMEQGYSFDTFAGKIRVNTETLYRWVELHEEFSDAKKQAFQLNRIFWEKVGIDGVTGRIENFNSTAWIFNMKNRFLWRDQRENVIEVSGLHGGPIQIANMNADERKKRLQVAQEKMKRLIEAVVVENESEEAKEEKD